jgi:phosphatidylserine/phosphatidylglycerophosphate/cardiolipin synthase-like enzyme
MDHRKCLAETNFAKPAGQGTTAVLNVGRYGLYADRIQPSDQAMLMSFRSAKSTINLSQQDLGFVGNIYWKAGMSEIGKAIGRGVDVYIVLSDRGSKGGSNTYSNVSMENTADTIKKYVAEETKKSGPALNNLLCDKMHLTTLRFGPSEHWKDGGTFANHAKFIMVDDAVFYVGSSNMYSSDLQEYGVFIDDPKAVGQIKTDYYDKLWSYSQRAAISGTGVKNCYYKK